jgi:uncharacterized protein (UPF0332 family)
VSGRGLQRLLHSGLVRSYKGGREQAPRQLGLALRDLSSARRLLAEDRDWAFAIAYNAVLQAGRALMLREGYRPTTGEGGHVAVIRFCEEFFGPRYQEEMELFDRMRVRRNRVVYDVSGSISRLEADEAFTFAEDFVARVQQLVGRPERANASQPPATEPPASELPASEPPAQEPPPPPARPEA